jgi:hypothetical protein
MHLSRTRLALIISVAIAGGAIVAVAAQAGLSRSRDAAWTDLKLGKTDVVDNYTQSELAPANTWGTVPGMSKIVTAKGPIVVSFSGNVYLGTSCSVFYTAFVDGQETGASPYSFKNPSSTVSMEMGASFTAVTPSEPKGPHQVEIRWQETGCDAETHGAQLMEIQHS